MHTWTDVMTFPQLSWSRRKMIPAQIIPVGHRDHIAPSIAIEIGGDEVMDCCEILVEDNALEWFFSRSPGVAIPHASRDVVQPSVSIHVHGRAADIGGMVRAQQVPRPAVRREI